MVKNVLDLMEILNLQIPKTTTNPKHKKWRESDNRKSICSKFSSKENVLMTAREEKKKNISQENEYNNETRFPTEDNISDESVEHLSNIERKLKNQSA